MKCKPYKTDDSSLDIVNDPTVAYVYTDDFETVCVSALTSDEFRQQMYKRIDAWEWKNK